METHIYNETYGCPILKQFRNSIFASPLMTLEEAAEATGMDKYQILSLLVDQELQCSVVSFEVKKETAVALIASEVVNWNVM